MYARFSEYKPTYPVDCHIQTYWTGDFNPYSENRFEQTVVPNGCIELIIHLTHDHCELVKANSWETTPHFIVIGMHTGPYTVRFNRSVAVFGIRFHPDGFYAIFGVPPAAMTHTFEDSESVLGNDFAGYCSRLRECPSAAERIELSQNFFLSQLARHRYVPEYLHAAPELIRKHRGLITMDAIYKQVPISPRQLQRAFKIHYGITAKEYMRLARLNAIQTYMQSNPVNLTDVSYENGFTDQSHFIREFTRLTGMNPKRFLKQRSHFIVNPLPPHKDPNVNLLLPQY